LESSPDFSQNFSTIANIRENFLLIITIQNINYYSSHKSLIFRNFSQNVFEFSSKFRRHFVEISQLLAAIEKQQWKDANDLSNKLEAYVVEAAGGIDIDDVMNADSPIDNVIAAMTTYLNKPGEPSTTRITTGLFRKIISDFYLFIYNNLKTIFHFRVVVAVPQLLLYMRQSRIKI
jgi:hypothetical protein